MLRVPVLPPVLLLSGDLGGLLHRGLLGHGQQLRLVLGLQEPLDVVAEPGSDSGFGELDVALVRRLKTLSVGASHTVDTTVTILLLLSVLSGGGLLLGDKVAGGEQSLLHSRIDGLLRVEVARFAVHMGLRLSLQHRIDHLGRLSIQRLVNRICGRLRRPGLRRWWHGSSILRRRPFDHRWATVGIGWQLQISVGTIHRRRAGRSVRYVTLALLSLRLSLLSLSLSLHGSLLLSSNSLLLSHDLIPLEMFDLLLLQHLLLLHLHNLGVGLLDLRSNEDRSWRHFDRSI